MEEKTPKEIAEEILADSNDAPQMVKDCLADRALAKAYLRVEAQLAIALNALESTKYLSDELDVKSRVSEALEQIKALE